MTVVAVDAQALDVGRRIPSSIGQWDGALLEDTLCEGDGRQVGAGITILAIEQSARQRIVHSRRSLEPALIQLHLLHGCRCLLTVGLALLDIIRRVGRLAGRRRVAVHLVVFLLFRVCIGPSEFYFPRFEGGRRGMRDSSTYHNRVRGYPSWRDWVPRTMAPPGEY